jgi:hypothetical protein
MVIAARGMYTRICEERLDADPVPIVALSGLLTCGGDLDRAERWSFSGC